jgi:hypothetical protein
MDLALALGLVAAIALYLIAIYAISRHADWPFPSLDQIAKRHGLSWPAGLVGTFALLNLIGVPFSQQVLIAVVLSGFFASLWFQAVNGGSPPLSSLPARYRFRAASDYGLMWLDWFGLLATLCFATELVWTLFK